MFETIRQDIRHAARSLRRTPGFAAATIITLALGIGATTAIVAMVDAVLLRPLPYGDPDGLVTVWEEMSADGFPRNTPAPANYLDWRNRNRVFQGMAATVAANASIIGDGSPEQVLGRRVTANFFDVLGARPARGRTFSDEEDRLNAPVVMISHRLWRRRYLGDPGVVGRTITMNEAKVTVIGVMPEAFVFRNREIDFWSPISLTPAQAANRSAHMLNIVARLRAGVGLEQARADMADIARALAREHPENQRVGVDVVPIREEVFGDTRQQLAMLTMAALCLLLIACANLACLLLARGVARRREMATRAALGASRTRVIAQTMVEGITWSVSGGVVGLAVAAAGIRVLNALVPTTLSAAVAPQLDGRVLAFTLILAVLTGIVFTVIPAVLSTRVSLTEAMQQGARTNVGRGRGRFRATLVTLQVAVTFVLLVAAGLMLQSLANLRAFDVGFQSDGLLTMRTALPVPKYSDPVRRLRFYNDVLDGVQQLPGVVGAGFASTLPFTSRGNTAGYRVEGRPFDPNQPDDALFRVVTSDYLSTLRVRLRAGRLPNEDDGPDSLPVVFVNETFARRHWPDEGAIGHRIALTGPDAVWMTVVGVVADVYEAGYEVQIRPGMYVVASQAVSRSDARGRPVDNLVVRVATDPLAIAPADQRVIGSIDPEQPVAAVRTMEQIIDLEVVDRRQQSIVLSVFAALALLLASIGLYGLLSYFVAQRRREIGLRIVLGATTGVVTRLIAGQGLVLAGTGLALGLVAALAGTRLMEGLLYGVQPSDALTFGTVAALLAAVCALACWIPAYRAAKVSPQIVLQSE